MHFAYFVLLPRKGSKTADEAIKNAENWLNNNDFSGEGGYYSSYKSDWFEMGGRWSGIFTEMKLPKPKLTKFYNKVKTIEEKYGKIWDETLKKYKGGTKEWMEAYPKLDKAKQDEIVALWKESFPKVGYAPPIARSGTSTFQGFPRTDSDDAVKMNEALFRRWKKEYGHKKSDTEFVIVDENECGDEALVSDLKYKDVKDKWVVVVDYHT